jgi:hypothetical protein
MTIVWIWQNLSGSLASGQVGHEVTLVLPASIFDAGVTTPFDGLVRNGLCSAPAYYPFGAEDFLGADPGHSGEELNIQVFDQVRGWIRVTTFSNLEGHTGITLYGITSGGPLNFTQPVSFRIANSALTARSWTNLNFHLTDLCWLHEITPAPSHQGGASSLIVLHTRGGARASGAGAQRGRSSAQVTG